MTRVLLVDDSPAMRHYVTRTLHMTGIEMTIEEAENGLDAIGKAFAIRPDVIITDLNMPEMSGQELIARVQAADELQATRVLVLSADHCSEHVSKAMLSRPGPVSGYLTKPVTPELPEKQSARDPAPARAPRRKIRERTCPVRTTCHRTDFPDYVFLRAALPRPVTRGRACYRNRAAAFSGAATGEFQSSRVLENLAFGG